MLQPLVVSEWPCRCNGLHTSPHRRLPGQPMPAMQGGWAPPMRSKARAGSAGSGKVPAWPVFAGGSAQPTALSAGTCTCTCRVRRTALLSHWDGAGLASPVPTGLRRRPSRTGQRRDMRPSRAWPSAASSMGSLEPAARSPRARAWRACRHASRGPLMKRLPTERWGRGASSAHAGAGDRDCVKGRGTGAKMCRRWKRCPPIC
eukprot:scaffold4647_cov393-Prasinococcus_capsulatus_cf.AAC.12